MPHPRCPPGIGVDLLHLPRLTRVLFPVQKKPTGPNFDLRPLQRFASRILSAEELHAFNSRFLGENVVNAKSPQWPEDVKRWLGVRWAAKEALYKAYPYPDLLSRKNRRGNNSGGVDDGVGLEETEWREGEVKGAPGEAGRLTWKEVTMKYDAISGKPFLVIKRMLEGGTNIWEANKEDTALLSITHDGEYICAMVLYTGNTQGISTDAKGLKILDISERGLRGKVIDKSTGTVTFARPNWDYKTKELEYRPPKRGCYPDKVRLGRRDYDTSATE